MRALIPEVAGKERIGFGAVLDGVVDLATMYARPSEAAFEGNWRNPRKTVIISIATCGESLCGIVQWASDRRKPTLGQTAPILWSVQSYLGVSPIGDGKWKGQLFVLEVKQKVEG